MNNKYSCKIEDILYVYYLTKTLTNSKTKGVKEIILQCDNDPLQKISKDEKKTMAKK